MNLELPDGTIVEDIPDNISKAEMRSRLASNGYDVSKLDAPSQASYSNEGHNRPLSTPTKGQLLQDELAGLRQTINTEPKLQRGIRSGLLKSLSNTVEASGLKDVAPSGVKLEGGPDLKALAESEYAQDLPGSETGKILGDIGLTWGPAGKAASVAGNAIRGQAPGLLRKALAIPLESAAGGATAGALAAPDEGENRGVNALQGGLAGGVAGPAVGGLVKSYTAAKRFLGLDPVTRAAKYFEKALGPKNMEIISNNADLPTTLPMSLAARVGVPEVNSLEKISRGRADLSRDAAWKNKDWETNESANKSLQNAVGDDIADIQVRAAEKRDALSEAQAYLNKVNLSKSAKEFLDNDLKELVKDPLFRGSKAGHNAINDIRGMLSLEEGERLTAGTLANIHTGQEYFGKMSGEQTRRVRDVIKKHIDVNSGGVWSASLAMRNEADEALQRAEAGRNILREFQTDLGVSRGKVNVAGDPIVDPDKLQNAMVKYGSIQGKGDQPTIDLLTTQTRDQLDELVRALRQAKAPQIGTGGKIDTDAPWARVPLESGGSLPGVKSYWLSNVLRKATNRALGGRFDKTLQAADDILLDKVGWRDVEAALAANKNLSASDAERLGSIIRNTAKGSAAAVESADDKKRR